jgi:hypothetical protein
LHCDDPSVSKPLFPGNIYVVTLNSQWGGMHLPKLELT